MYSQGPTHKGNRHAQHDDWDEVHQQMIEVQQQKIQKKSLAVSNPGDADEKEADEVARKVSSGESAEIHGTGGAINRKGEGSAETTPEFQSKLESSKGGGQSLDDSTKSEMESKMGADFSGVKIHTGGEAHGMSESINARAFTHGQDVYFKQGEFDTRSSSGKELLAHELVHTVQQGNSVQRRVQRKEDIDQPASIKIIQNRLGVVPQTGAWDPPTTTKLNEHGVKDATNHEEILKWLFGDIAGRSKSEITAEFNKIAGLKGELTEIKDLIDEAKALYQLSLAIMPTVTKSQDIDSEKVKTNIPMILEIRSEAEVSGLRSLKKEEISKGESENFGKNIPSVVQSEQLDLDLQTLLKGEGVTNDLSGFKYTEDQIKIMDEQQIKRPDTVKAGATGTSLEGLVRKAYTKFYAISDLTTQNRSLPSAGGKSSVNVGTEGVDQLKLEANSANYFDAIIQLKKRLMGKIASKYTTENNLQIIGVNLDQIRDILKDTILADLEQFTKNTLAKIDPNSNSDLLKNIESIRANLKSELPNHYQMLINVGLDYLNISRSQKGILSIHYDDRVAELKVKSIADVFPAEQKDMAPQEIKTPAGDPGAVILTEPGGLRTILLSDVIFDNVELFSKVVTDAVNAPVITGNAKLTSLPEKSIFKGLLKDRTADRPGRVADNQKIWTDPRSVKIIQSYVGVPVTGVFDELTVEGIGRWQRKKGTARRPHDDFGVFGIDELRKAFTDLNSKGHQNASIQLIVDYYNFYDELSRMDDKGDFTKNAPIVHSTMETDPLLEMHYQKDALPQSKREAAVTYGSSGLPSYIRIGEENMASFDNVVSTIAHEFVHVAQNTTGTKMPTPLQEMYAEKMELTGSFGNIPLPKNKSNDAHLGDYHRAAKEYLKLDIPDSRANKTLLPDLKTLLLKNYLNTWTSTGEEKIAVMEVVAMTDKIQPFLDLVYAAYDTPSEANVLLAVNGATTFTAAWTIPSTVTLQGNIDFIKQEWLEIQEQAYLPLLHLANKIDSDIGTLNDQIAGTQDQALITGYQNQIASLDKAKLALISSANYTNLFTLYAARVK